MPTTHRRNALRKLSLACLNSQTYKNFKLYVDAREPEQCSLGEKYNSLHEAAIADGAEYLLVWSDDDWQSPTSIEYRMRAFVEDPHVKKCGFRRLHFADLSTGKLYYVPCDKQPENWVAHLSMIIRRDVFLQSPGYPDERVGSDSGFQKRTSSVRAAILDSPANEPRMIAMQHGGNTYKQDTRSSAWRKWYMRCGVGKFVENEEEWRDAASAS